MSVHLFEDQEFKGDHTIMQGARYEYCIFRGGDYHNSDLSQCRFVNCDFFDCNFSNANFSHVGLQECSFNECKMLGFPANELNQAGLRLLFQDCKLDSGIFYGVNLKAFQFKNCSLKDADFSEANAEGKSFEHCDFLNAVFDQTNLLNADLRNSVNYRIDPRYNKVKGLRVSLPHAVGLLLDFGVVVQ